jgi:hypothetical protein
MRASPWTNTRRSLRRISDLLCFRAIKLREYAIAKAHMTTYKWIFTNPDAETETRPYESFRAGFRAVVVYIGYLVNQDPENRHS